MKKLLFILNLLLCLSVINLTGKALAIYGLEKKELPKRFIIGLSQKAQLSSVREFLKARGLSIKRQLNSLNALSVEGPRETIIQELKKLKNLDDYYLEEDAVATVQLTPNDPYFAAYQWGLENTGQVINGQSGKVDADIDASGAWDFSNPQSLVAVLDTGIDSDHPELAGKITNSKNFSDSTTSDDLYGHGTHVAGIIAAAGNNNLGVIGVCPNCTLLNGKVLNDAGSGYYSWIAEGIIWAADQGAKVINLSLGGTSSSKVLEDAVNYAWNKGVVVVAAAGNNNSQIRFYPASYTNVIAVASTNNQDLKSSYSNYGRLWVDVAAPGEMIYSLLPNHTNKIGTQNYGWLSGTSMASPCAAAVAALVWGSKYGTSNSVVRSRVEKTADFISGTSIFWRWGRINAEKAVK